MKELERLEHQLDSSLRKVRSSKVKKSIEINLSIYCLNHPFQCKLSYIMILLFGAD